MTVRNPATYQVGAAYTYHAPLSSDGYVSLTPTDGYVVAGTYDSRGRHVAGTTALDTGFSVEKVATGVYKVTLPGKHPRLRSVTATLCGTATIPAFTAAVMGIDVNQTTAAGSQSFKLVTQNAAGAAANVTEAAGIFFHLDLENR